MNVRRRRIEQLLNQITDTVRSLLQQFRTAG
jgi:hypothetical protein